jgi:hypothetical protein
MILQKRHVGGNEAADHLFLISKLPDFFYSLN